MPSADETLRQFAGYNVRRANNVMQAKMMKLLAPFSLRRETFSALTVIRDNPGLRQADMAKYIAIDRPHAVLIVNELVESGLVKRKRSSKDRRASELSLTSKGGELHKRAIAEVQRFEDTLIDGLTDEECKELVRLLNLFERNAENFVKGRCDDQ